MSEVNWGALMRSPDYAGNIMRAFENGRETAEKAALGRAMRDLSQGPNPDALRVVYQINPQLGMQVENALYQRAERQRETDSRSAMTGMLMDALRGQPSPPPQGNALVPPNARPDAGPVDSGTIANPAQPVTQPRDPLAPLPGPEPQGMAPQQRAAWDQYIGKVAQWADTPDKWNQAVDYFVQQGYPDAEQYRGVFSPHARATLMQRGGITDNERRLIEADPEGFLKFQGQRLDVTAKQLKGHMDANNAAMQLLGSVHDQASYDAAKQQALQLYSSFGHDAAEFIAQLPPQYSPQTIRMLQLRGMDTSRQLAAIARENNIESQIEVREGRLAEYRRRGRASEANQRRGQDIRSRDTRRGQDVTDRRLRETGGRKGGGTKRNDLIGPVYTKGGRRIQYSKGAGGYVDVATGEAVN